MDYDTQAGEECGLSFSSLTLIIVRISLVGDCVYDPPERVGGLCPFRHIALVCSLDLYEHFEALDLQILQRCCVACSWSWVVSVNWWFSLLRNKKIKSRPFNDRSYEFQIL